jgi:hypothetical protein
MLLMTYTVALVNFHHGPQDMIHAAEARFRAALDRTLADRVAPTLRAFQRASTSNANLLTIDEATLAADWESAYANAKEEGFRGLGYADEAYFEVRLA